MISRLKFQELRGSFKPKEVRVLFVGESRPANGTFFYSGDSNLFMHTVAVFQDSFKLKYDSTTNFLESFKRYGCWLTDLCEEPVNRLSDIKREIEREQGIGPLIETIKKTEPKSIICVMRGIDKYVKRAIGESGINLLSYSSVPFPVRTPKNVLKYKAELAEILRDLVKREIMLTS